MEEVSDTSSMMPAPWSDKANSCLGARWCNIFQRFPGDALLFLSMHRASGVTIASIMHNFVFFSTHIDMLLMCTCVFGKTFYMFLDLFARLLLFVAIALG